MTMTVSSDHAIAEMTVESAMTRDFVAVGPDAPLLEAFALMLRHEIHHLPVVGSNRRCVALLSFPDVVVRLPRALVDQGGSVMPDPGARGPILARSDQPLVQAAATMDSNAVDACCVVDACGRMVGLLTARDVLRALARAVPPAASTWVT
jgi:CBS domain-containing membrane protein